MILCITCNIQSRSYYYSAEVLAISVENRMILLIHG